jgi:hypothetical protein
MGEFERSRSSFGAGTGRECGGVATGGRRSFDVLPALLDEIDVAELQVDLRRVRVLHVLFGLLLRNAQQR